MCLAMNIKAPEMGRRDDEVLTLEPLIAFTFSTLR
jgi:hypothetical protein